MERRLPNPTSRTNWASHCPVTNVGHIGHVIVDKGKRHIQLLEEVPNAARPLRRAAAPHGSQFRLQILERRLRHVFTPPEATNTGPGFNRGAGGGARGCDFEERVGAYARTEGGIISYSLQFLYVCLSVATTMAVGLFDI